MMKPRSGSIIGVLAGLAAIMGCVHTRDLTEADLRGLVDPARERVVPVGRDGLVRMRDGSDIRARSIVLRPDALSWSDSESGREVQVQASLVAELEYRNRMVGLFEGIGMGMLPGIVIMGVAFALPDESSGPGLFSSPRAGVGIFGFFFSVLGGVVGGAAGVVKGGRTIVRLPMPTSGEGMREANP
jgi:hypothetical protein